jgi:hypothetical protein
VVGIQKQEKQYNRGKKTQCKKPESCNICGQTNKQMQEVCPKTAEGKIELKS